MKMGERRDCERVSLSNFFFSFPSVSYFPTLFLTSLTTYFSMLFLFIFPHFSLSFLTFPRYFSGLFSRNISHLFHVFHTLSLHFSVSPSLFLPPLHSHILPHNALIGQCCCGPLANKNKKQRGKRRERA